MALQIGPILVEVHLSGPVLALVVTGRAPDVVDAQRPRGVVAIVVLGAQRLKAKLADCLAGWEG